MKNLGHQVIKREKFVGKSVFLSESFTGCTQKGGKIVVVLPCASPSVKRYDIFHFLSHLSEIWHV